MQRSLLVVSFIVALHNALSSPSSTLPPIKMVNSNPVLEMVVDGAPVRLILTTDLDGIVVCQDARTSRRDWLMSDTEFDNARKRLRYELRWVSPKVKECEVQTPALAYSGRVNVGFFRLDNQEMQMAAVAYYLGSLGADGFVGAGFTLHPEQSVLWETIQEAAVDSHNSKAKGEVFISSNEIEWIETTDEEEADKYVWSETFVPVDDGNDEANSQGISFPIYDASFTCNESGSDPKTQIVRLFADYSSSWDVVVDFNSPCLQLPKEFYDALAGWIGLRLNSRLGLSEISAPPTALPDILFSLTFAGVQLALPLRSLVLPELSGDPLSDGNSTKICIQRSVSMLQRGTAAFAAPTTTAAEVAKLQRLHGTTGIPVYNMIDSPITFGAMVLDALGSVTINEVTKRVGILIPSAEVKPAEQSTLATCLQSVSCVGEQEFVVHLNACQDPDCSRYYFHSLDMETRHCVIGSSWRMMLVATTTLFVTAELFFSLSLRRLVLKSQHRATS